MSFIPAGEPPVASIPKSSAIEPLAATVLVSLATTPWLLTIVAMRTTSAVLERVGLNSEEIFRGDRLPVIRFPNPDS